MSEVKIKLPKFGKRSKKYLRVLGILFIVTIPLLIYWVFNYGLKVKKLKCKDQFGDCSLEFESQLIGKSILTGKREIKKLLMVDPSVSSFSVRYQIPVTLVVDEVKDVPKFAVYNPDYGGYALVNEKGYVTEIVEHSDLAKLKTNQKVPNVGEIIDKKSLFALSLYQRLSGYSEFNDAVFVDDHLEIIDENGIKIIFPSDGDQDIILGSLILILSRLKEDQEKIRIKQEITEIDLRFKNPILR